jgi:toxin YoeB
MAERKIIWSDQAKNSLSSILEFYTHRNKSKAYSVKVYKRISKELKLLRKFPYLGIKTDLPGIRGLIIDPFILFYELDGKFLVVHHVWDSRQDPDQLRII